MSLPATNPNVNPHLEEDKSREVCIDCQPDPQLLSSDAGSKALPNPNAEVKEGKGEGKKEEDLMDPQTFIPPLNLTSEGVEVGWPTPLVVIEYCQRCKFGLRANWIQQELLSTFAPISPTSSASKDSAASVGSVMMIPKVDDASAGRFRVYLLPDPTTSFNSSTATSAEEARREEKEKERGYQRYEGGLVLVWDRKSQGGFPEMRILKQRVRDLINPTFGLGHSDKA